MTEMVFKSCATWHGTVDVFPQDDPIGRSLSEYGEWAGRELALLRSLVKPSHTVIDVGANIGTHSLELSRAVGSVGTVHAFEPQAHVFELLQRNIQQCGATNVRLYNVALGALEAEGRMDSSPYDSHFNFGAGQLSTHGNELVSIQRLDHYNIDACDLIKIDVEGMVNDVLIGSNCIIGEFNPYLYIECNDVDSAVDVWRNTSLFSYRKIFVQTPAFNPDNFNSNPHNFFGYATETAVLCVPPSREMPTEIEGIYMRAVRNLNDLSACVLSAPRYGDTSQFEHTVGRRVLEHMASELERARLRELNLRRGMEHALQRVPTPPSELLIQKLRTSRVWPALWPLRRLARQYLERLK